MTEDQIRQMQELSAGAAAQEEVKRRGGLPEQIAAAVRPAWEIVAGVKLWRHPQATFCAMGNVESWRKLQPPRRKVLDAGERVSRAWAMQNLLGYRHAEDAPGVVRPKMAGDGNRLASYFIAMDDGETWVLSAMAINDGITPVFADTELSLADLVELTFCFARPEDAYLNSLMGQEAFIRAAMEWARDTFGPDTQRMNECAAWCFNATAELRAANPTAAAPAGQPGPTKTDNLKDGPGEADRTQA